MYKVLIIDDEEPVRRAVKKLGEWKSIGVKSIFEGFNGQMGMELLREHKPDIVFVDMKMPVMNGVEFLEIACRENPKAEYIVISGYSDFEYTKQAIKVKVLDYLLKPISAEELNIALRKAVDRLEVKHSQTQKDFEKSIETNIMTSLLKEKVLNDLVMGAGNPQLLREYKSKLDLDESGKYYGVALLCMLNFEKICIEKFYGDAHIFYFSVINIVDELGNENFQCSAIKSVFAPHEIIIVLADKGQAAPTDQGELAHVFLTKVNETLQNLFGIYSIAVIGRFYDDLYQINKSFIGAEAALNRVNLLNHGKNIFFEKEINNFQEDYSIRDKKLLIFNAISSRNTSYANQVISDYFNEIRTAGNFNLQSARRTVMEFMDIIEAIAKELGISEENTVLDIRDSTMPIDVKNIEELSVYLSYILNKIIDIHNLKETKTEKVVINNIKKYIDENYSEEITLSKFSEKFYLSKEYLCRIFKEEFGYGIYEYTLRVRMEKAKEMLENPYIKIQSVAEMLGYSDSNYFSKAFKKYFGYSPTENKNRHKCSGE